MCFHSIESIDIDSFINRLIDLLITNLSYIHIDNIKD